MGRRPKYGNHKVTIDGIQFDSKHEGFRYAELKILERAGEISDLKLQVSYELIPSFKSAETGKWTKPTHYIADFVYKDKDGNTVVEDAKGFKTEVYRIKKKAMAYKYGIYIQEV